MRTPLLLSILALATPIAARAEPQPTDVAGGDCGDPHRCEAVELANALSSQPVHAQARLGFVIGFEPGRARVYSKDRERLMALAESWRRDSGWATVTVESQAPAPGSIALAQRRVDRIAEYLIRYGVPGEYVVAIAYEPVHGDARNERAGQGHVALTLEHCPRTTPECQHSPVKPRSVAESTARSSAE
jgi:hypothetical protein